MASNRTGVLPYLHANIYTSFLKLSVSKLTIENSGIFVRFAHMLRPRIRSKAIQCLIDLIILFSIIRLYNGTNLYVLIIPENLPKCIYSHP